MKPLMAVSRLLKSWATPPASRPTASIFCACRSCSSKPLVLGDVVGGAEEPDHDAVGPELGGGANFDHARGAVRRQQAGLVLEGVAPAHRARHQLAQDLPLLGMDPLHQLRDAERRDGPGVDAEEAVELGRPEHPVLRHFPGPVTEASDALRFFEPPLTDADPFFVLLAGADVERHAAQSDPLARGVAQHAHVHAGPDDPAVLAQEAGFVDPVVLTRGRLGELPGVPRRPSPGRPGGWREAMRRGLARHSSGV